MELSLRQKHILQAILKENLKTASPVSSAILVERHRLNYSPATVRNEMMALEEASYIFQPHTSSGRVPTEEAWRWYLEEIFSNQQARLLSSLEKNMIEDSWDEANLKNTAKALAEISGLAVFWAFNRRDFYYTGLANLFSQSELRHLEAVYDVSLAIDKMEEVVESLLHNKDFGVQVLLGEENPFGSFLGTVFLKYGQTNREALVGVLGPMRMDYSRTISLLELLKDKLTNNYGPEKEK